MTRKFAIYAFAFLILSPIEQTIAYVDTDEEDIVIDAPWRTIRDYVPGFFSPEFKKQRELFIEKIELFNFDPATGDPTSKILEDSRDENYTLTCPGGAAVAFIDPDGRSRSPISASEEFDSFWHYIVRVPTSCLRNGALAGESGEYFLYGKATVIAELYSAFYKDANMIEANNNAFGRVRTYTLTLD